jgi:ABC-type dipeptide/oligopeptide/nickel transport system permease component
VSTPTLDPSAVAAPATPPTSPAARSGARSRNPWVSFLRRRLGRLLVSVWVLVTAAFAMIHLIPGDPVRAALGITASAELVERRRADLGLDRPLPVQYLDYIGKLLRGDLGTSTTSGLPVSQIVGDRLPATLSLGVLAFVVIMLLALPLGVVTAVLTHGGRRRAGELGFTAVTGVLAAIPEFLVAVGLVFLFSVTFPVFPVAGRSGPESYVLPVIALAIAPMAALARIVRVEALRVLGEDYVRTARAKRLRPRLVYLRHALPNMLTSSLTIGGLLLSGLIAGTVLVENIFAWPGLGTTIVGSITQQDYSLVQGIVLVYGLAVLLVNLVVDVLLAVLDPRSTIRES